MSRKHYDTPQEPKADEPMGAAEPEAGEMAVAEPAAAPREKTLFDYFGCRCGERRNLSMEGGVYRCVNCGDEQTAQTLENRKAADK